MADKNSSSDGRTRTWVAVVYPDSAPDNWRELLDENHIEWAESPLHDRDVNPGTGEVKKAHWHIALSFDGKKSYEQVFDLLAPLKCAIPQRCHSLRGAIRYMAHLDNPEKFQYGPENIIGHGGFDVQSYLKRSTSEATALVREMLEWARSNDIREYSKLVNYAMDEKPDWFDVLANGYTVMLSSYFRSVRGADAGGEGKRIRAASGARAVPLTDDKVSE